MALVSVILLTLLWQEFSEFKRPVCERGVEAGEELVSKLGAKVGKLCLGHNLLVMEVAPGRACWFGGGAFGVTRES
jgi:hypothetical protein